MRPAGAQFCYSASKASLDHLSGNIPGKKLGVIPTGPRSSPRWPGARHLPSVRLLPIFHLTLNVKGFAAVGSARVGEHKPLVIAARVRLGRAAVPAPSLHGSSVRAWSSDLSPSEARKWYTSWAVAPGPSGGGTVRSPAPDMRHAVRCATTSEKARRNHGVYRPGCRPRSRWRSPGSTHL